MFHGDACACCARVFFVSEWLAGDFVRIMLPAFVFFSCMHFMLCRLSECTEIVMMVDAAHIFAKEQLVITCSLQDARVQYMLLERRCACVTTRCTVNVMTDEP